MHKTDFERTPRRTLGAKIDNLETMLKRLIHIINQDSVLYHRYRKDMKKAENLLED